MDASEEGRDRSRISVTMPTAYDPLTLEDYNATDFENELDVELTDSQVFSNSTQDSEFDFDAVPDAPCNSNTELENIKEDSRTASTTTSPRIPSASKKEMEPVKPTKYKPAFPKKHTTYHQQLGARKPILASRTKSGRTRMLQIPGLLPDDSNKSGGHLSSRGEVICTMVSIVADADNDVGPPRSKSPVAFSNTNFEHLKLESSFSHMTTYTSKTLLLDPDVPGPSEIKVTLDMPHSPSLSRNPSLTSLRQSSFAAEHPKEAALSSKLDQKTEQELEIELVETSQQLQLPESTAINSKKEKEKEKHSQPLPRPPSLRVRPPTAKNMNRSGRRPATSTAATTKTRKKKTAEKIVPIQEMEIKDREHRCSQSSLMDAAAGAGSIKSGSKTSMRSISSAKIDPKERPVSAPAKKSGGGASRPKSGGSTDTVYAGEPCVLVTRKRFAEMETARMLECKNIHEKLTEKGLIIKPETLKRGLLPPSEFRQEFYEMPSCTLPSNFSSGLLSHPSTWLPREFAKVEEAKKQLRKYEELMIMKRNVEVRSRPSTAGVDAQVYTAFERSGMSRGSLSQSSIGGGGPPGAGGAKSATGTHRTTRKKSGGKRRPHSAEAAISVTSRSSLAKEQSPSVSSAGSIAELTAAEDDTQLAIPETIEEELSSQLQASNYWDTANNLLHSGLTPCNSKSDLFT